MSTKLPDELLARRAAIGHIEDFEELVHRYRDRVFRICYRMAGNREDAEDWAQECFLRIYRNIGRYRSEWPFQSWVTRVTANTCINLAKSRTRRRANIHLGLPEDVGGEGSACDPMMAAASNMERRRCEAAIAALSPVLRQALVLRVLEGLSFREVAEVLNVPLQTAASRVRRALQEVRRRLEAAGVEVEK
ncbi:MAG: RNA polymerase sigma factor [Chthonomonadales bacterium]